MSQFGWGLVGRLVREEEPKGNLYYLKHAYLGYKYATDPLTRVVWDTRIAQHRFPSGGLGGPSGTTPTSTIPSKRRQGRASAESGKPGRTPSSSGSKESRARRKSCPKGHYWSYKEKKCLKSKFRHR